MEKCWVSGSNRGSLCVGRVYSHRTILERLNLLEESDDDDDGGGIVSGTGTSSSPSQDVSSSSPEDSSSGGEQQQQQVVIEEADGVVWGRVGWLQEGVCRRSWQLLR